MCHTEHIIHIWMLTPVFLLGIKHQKVPHRAYSDDSDAHQFCVSQHQDAVVVTGQLLKASCAKGVSLLDTYNEKEETSFEISS